MDYSEDIKKLEESIEAAIKVEYFLNHIPMIASKITVLEYLKRKQGNPEVVVDATPKIY